MAAANMKRHGNVMVPEAREMTTWPDSSGCRFVNNHLLQLTERPAVQSASDAFPGLDVIPDMRQDFQGD